MTDHAVVSREDWLNARRALLAREKEETHLRDAVNAERLALPWVKVDKAYRFHTPDGERSLADLFDGRSQLLVYHFMLAPDWDAGCPGCSFLCDHIDGAIAHLTHHDVTLTAVSRAPLDRIEAYKRRMGWHFPWASSHGSDFNYDYHVSWTPEQLASGRVDYNFAEEGIEVRDDGTESPGMSAFFKDEDGTIFHTYSAYARGIEDWIGTLMILDRAPKGRNKDDTMNFVRRHDEYEDAAPKAAACH
jgi:predicted dithiol-disulfide oxidoreductase (DUF899 family)